jgi:hypothetical protein
MSGVAYDTRREVAVLYGGIDSMTSSRYADTWEWNGKRWEERWLESPGPRDHHVMVYDAARGCSVVYGGSVMGTSWYEDTWEWDGVRWRKVEAKGPGTRAHFAMAFDSIRRRILLFGGVSRDMRYHNDLWAWDGTAWTLIGTDGPEPRARHRMAFDSRRNQLVLYGGDGIRNAESHGFQVLDDTWIWDGNLWARRSGTRPGSRMMHAMAFDEVRGRVVLHGGGQKGTSVDDTWEWDGERWAEVG